MDDPLAGIDRIVAPAGLNLVTPGTTWWLYAVTELVPDVELGRRLLVDSDRIPLDHADRPEHADLLRSIGDALRANAQCPDALPANPPGPLAQAPDAPRANAPEPDAPSANPPEPDAPSANAPSPDARDPQAPQEIPDLLETSARLLATAGVLRNYPEPADYLADMAANGIVVLRLV